MWFISTLAETNCAPSNFTEGKSDLVSGLNSEYADGPFVLFFIAEYTNIILINALSTIVFIGPFHDPYNPELFTISFISKTLILTTLFLWIRASYPRFHYDQLIHLLWKNFLPLTLAFGIRHISIPSFIASIPPYTYKYVWPKSYFGRVNNRDLSPLISRIIGIEPIPKNSKFSMPPKHLILSLYSQLTKLSGPYLENVGLNPSRTN